MAVITAGNRHQPKSFYQGPSYTPDQIGNWVAAADGERDLPWNTIGKALKGHGKGKTTGRLMTAAEVLKETGLDVEVYKWPVSDPGTGLAIPKLFVTGIEDPNTEGGRFYFGAVSDTYQVVQPVDALTTFDHIVHNHKGAHYSAAWDMREKARMGVTLEFPEHIVLDPGGREDVVGLYGLGENSFDGTTSLGYHVTAARMWCMNVLPMATRQAVRSIRFKHTRGVSARVSDARQALGITLRYAEAFDAEASALIQRDMSDAAFGRWLKTLRPFKCDEDATDLVRDRVERRVASAHQAWEATHNENIRGTRWGAFNIVAEYLDWGRNVLGSPRTGTDVARQRAIGTLVGGTVTVLRNEAWESIRA